jgi:prolyl-tRNA synthetase
MKLSKLFLPTLREIPADADTISAKLMIRAGMIRKLTSGIYEWLPLGLKVLKKVERIVREEMDAVDGQEVSLPLLLPKELWEETDRWQMYGKELFRMKDRKDAEFCLGPTHEEVVTDIVRNEVRSYRELPLMLYQFGIKFRDEIRPRFGVMRAREFYMKDAYSFHASEEDAENCYGKVFDAYARICDRCGFKYRSVEATTGAIGGKFSHEFMVLADTGEEEIAACKCGYAANVEKAECIRNEGKKQDEKKEALEEVHTPDMGTIEKVGNFLKVSPDKFIKTLIYSTDSSPVMVLVRGDCEINETKLKGHLQCNELNLADTAVIEKVTGAPVGFAGPAGLDAKLKIRTLADYSVENILNGISGANKADYHLKNVNIGRDYNPDEILDLRKFKKDDLCPRCNKSKLEFSRGIEVGHTFKLGMKYSKSMKATYLDSAGVEQYFIMGCYGIGVSRIVAAAIEQSHDENGIIWQTNLAPYKIIILPIDYSNAKIRKVSDELYESFVEKGYDVLLDDRSERPGVKFKDTDLIGIPVRITVGERNLPDSVEIKLRHKDKPEVIKLGDLPPRLKKILSQKQ